MRTAWRVVFLALAGVLVLCSWQLSAGGETAIGRPTTEPAFCVAAASTPAPAAGVKKRRAVAHPSNTGPAASDDAYQVSQASLLTVAAPGVLANDTINQGVIVSYGVNGTEQMTLGASTPTAQGGSVRLNANGSFTYDSDDTFVGTDTFRYRLSGSAALVTVTVVAIPPAAVDDEYQTAQNVPLSQSAPGVLANDTLNGASVTSYGAASGLEQTALGVDTPTAHNGTVHVNASGAFVYTPPAGFSGSDSFRYAVTNTADDSVATVTIAVSAPNATPDFTVTSPGFFYSFSGISGQNPKLTLQRGRTYRFLIDTDAAHPFEILDAPPGSVTNNDISQGTLTFAVPAGSGTYQYHCSIHDFGNTIETIP